MATSNVLRTAQRWLFPELEESQKSTVNGSTQAAKLSTYLHSREALWRLLACYPPQMPVVEALQHARVDFTKGTSQAGKEVAA